MDFPRRNRIDLLSKNEKKIYDLIGDVELLGSHPILTDVVQLLSQARYRLADFVDGNKVVGICAVCESEHELVILDKCNDDDGGWIDFYCEKEQNTFTHMFRQ